MVVTETWKSRPSVARATATMVVSRIDMIDPRTTTPEVRRSSGDRVNEVLAEEAMEYFILLKDMRLSKSLPGGTIAPWEWPKTPSSACAASPSRASTWSGWQGS